MVIGFRESEAPTLISWCLSCLSPFCFRGEGVGGRCRAGWDGIDKRTDISDGAEREGKWREARGQRWDEEEGRIVCQRSASIYEQAAIMKGRGARAAPLMEHGQGFFCQHLRQTFPVDCSFCRKERQAFDRISGVPEFRRRKL